MFLLSLTRPVAIAFASCDLPLFLLSLEVITALSQSSVRGEVWPVPEIPASALLLSAQASSVSPSVLPFLLLGILQM